MLGALGQQAVEQHLVEALRARERVGDALHRILIEIEPGRAEGEIEIGDDDVGLQDLRQRPGRVVADGRRADAALGADERIDVADRLGLGIVVEIGDRLHQLQRRDRLDQVFADAALQQIAIEHDVVDVPDDDHLGARIAVLRQAIELGEDVLARQAALDDDEVRRRVLLVVRHRRFDAAHVHADVRLGEAAVLGGDLHDLRHGGVLAEGLDGDARNGPRPRARRLLHEVAPRRRRARLQCDPLLGGREQGLGLVRHDLSDLG